jgi:cyclopropane fatty-acyl-phospholipid synthase-like methyltransferase
MRFIDHVHGGFIANRRARVFSHQLAKIIPNDFHVLDVGCGDGLIAYLIAETRHDIKLRGLDVLARDRSYISRRTFGCLPRPKNSRVKSDAHTERFNDTYIQQGIRQPQKCHDR